MAKKRRQIDEDDEFGRDDDKKCGQGIDAHLWPPNPQPDTMCYCGKKPWKPFIKLDDYLQPGMFIRTYPGGPIYEVEMVNDSRARCRLTTAQKALNKRASDTPDGEGEDDEQRGRIINISPRSACERVSRAELERETQPPIRSQSMASSKFAGTPVANGKDAKNAARVQKLAQKPKSAARPLTGAAAKAAANKRPKAPKTVRKCGCGCNGETLSYFIPGHDARYKGWMKKVADGRMSLDELKKAMGKSTFDKYTFKKSGGGFVAKESYQEAAGA